MDSVESGLSLIPFILIFISQIEPQKREKKYAFLRHVFQKDNEPNLSQTHRFRLLNFIKMFKKKQSLLLIDFDATQGLILKWTIPRHNYPVFFRHILFFDVSQEFDTKAFAQNYFQSLKAGDMITFSSITQLGHFHLLKWKQKSPISQINISRLQPSNSNNEDIPFILEKLAEQAQDLTEPIIYNYITQKDTKNLSEVQNIIKTWTGDQDQNRLCFNIFGDFETSIEPTTGVNYFSLEDFTQTNCKENWEFYKNYVSQISLFQIKITLECQNGSFASKKEDEWKNIDFNKITRNIHAPSNNYAKDTIQFLNEDNSSEVNYTINVLLQFTELDNQKFYASKKLSIRTISEKIYQRTFAGRQTQFSTEVFPGFYSRRNPFSSQSPVWFKKMMEI